MLVEMRQTVRSLLSCLKDCAQFKPNGHVDMQRHL